MNFDKIINSNFFRFSEKLYTLIILNIISFIFILLGLGVFTLMPTIVSLIVMIKSMNSERSIPLIRTFFKIFKNNYKKSEFVSIFYFLLISLFIYNTYYFYCWTNESSNFYYTIAYYFCLVVDITILLAFINACFVCVYFPHLSIKKTIKYSFKLLLAVFTKTIILFILLIVFIYLGVLVVYFVPTLLISFYCFIAYLLLNKPYNKIIPEGYKSQEALDYI